jgi:hypothetical protein
MMMEAGLLHFAAPYQFLLSTVAKPPACDRLNLPVAGKHCPAPMMLSTSLLQTSISSWGKSDPELLLFGALQMLHLLPIPSGI